MSHATIFVPVLVQFKMKILRKKLKKKCCENLQRINYKAFDILPSEIFQILNGF